VVNGYITSSSAAGLLCPPPLRFAVRHTSLHRPNAAAPDRNELGALLVAAGLGPPGEHALVSLLALNGLRVSEATGADIEHLGLDRGRRTLTITRKGGKVVTIRSSWLRTGGGWTGTAPDVSSARSRAAPGSPRQSRLIRSGMRSSPPRLDAGVPLRDVQEAASHADPRTTMRYDRATGSLDRHATCIVAAYVAGAAR
jgi:integrase/recombinase XerD